MPHPFRNILPHPILVEPGLSSSERKTEHAAGSLWTILGLDSQQEHGPRVVWPVAKVDQALPRVHSVSLYLVREQSLVRLDASPLRGWGQ
jgi:hypothetical protein